MKIKISFLAISSIVLFLLISCGDLVSPDFESAPSNIKIDKINNNTIRISWVYNEAEDDSIKYVLSKKIGGYQWNTDYAQTSNKYFYDNTPDSDTLVVSYKVLAHSNTEGDDTPNSEVVAYFSENAAPFNLQLQQTSEDQVVVSWQSRALGHEGFRVDRKVGTSNWDAKYKTLTTNQTQFTDNSELFTEVIYRVYCYSGKSNSDASEQFLMANMNPPSNLDSNLLDNNRIKLEWIDNSFSESGYSVDKKIGETDWQTDIARVNSNQYIANISEETASIYFRVRAYKDTIFSNYSDSTKTNVLLNPISQTETNGNANDIIIKDWVGFVADYYNGLTIYDCSNPVDIIEINHNLIIPDRTLSLDIDSNLLYVASTSNESEQGLINLVDIQNLAEPTNFISFFTNGIPYDIEVNGDHTFVADGEAGISIYYTGTSIPILEGSLNLNATAKKIKIYDHYALVVCGTSGLKIVDFNDMQNMNIVSEYSTNLLTDIIIKDSFAFLSDADLGLIILDLSNPTSPLEITNLHTGEYASNINIYDERAFIMDRELGLKAIDITDINNPYIIGSIDFDSNITSSYQYGSYLFVTDDIGIKIFKIKE